MSIEQLVRPHLRTLEPYRTARAEHAAAEEPTGEPILLDANENAFGTLAPELDAELHRYPDPEAPALRQDLSELTGADAERIWVGNGSDEAIDLLVRTVVAPGGTVVTTAPSYGVYRTRVRAHDARVLEVPLEDDGFDLDVDATTAAARDADLVLLCSPNNPTGNLLSRERILALVDGCDCVVAVDEAYIEFAENPSLAALGGDPERLAVIRTLSKAWGMAAGRVGYLVGAPALVRHMSRAGLPYPLSAPAMRIARLTLARGDTMRRRVASLLDERRRLRGALEALGLRVLPSRANFLLFFVPDPGAVQHRLSAEFGVVVRNRSHLPGLAGGLRVTVGTPRENARFLEGLEEIHG